MGRRLGPIDHAWLRMERPNNPMMVTGVLTFDEPVDVERLRRTIAERIRPFPRLRQRIRGGRGRWARWEEDPLFSIERHVVRRAIPAPGDRAALRHEIEALLSTPLPMDRALWMVHVLDNPRDGRSVVVVRLHHCIADGFALMYVMLSLTDGAPEVEDARAAPTNDEPGAVGQALRAIAHARRVGGRAAAAIAGDLLRLATLSTQPRSLLRGDLGPVKRVAWSPAVPLDEVKAIGRRRGGTVNDVLMAAVTGALSRYLRERGEDVSGFDLWVAVPVNLRTPAQMRELGNYFGLVFLELPLWIDEPRDRFAELKRRMDRLKSSPEPIVLLALMQITGASPRWLEELVVRFLGAKTTGVLTNVPGPREPRYLAGRRIRTVVFWVPQTGRVGLGVSIFSYAGEVRVGLAADARLLPDPDRVLDAFRAELDALR